LISLKNEKDWYVSILHISYTDDAYRNEAKKWHGEQIPATTTYNKLSAEEEETEENIDAREKTKLINGRFYLVVYESDAPQTIDVTHDAPTTVGAGSSSRRRGKGTGGADP
jgi:hypothetical protein